MTVSGLAVRVSALVCMLVSPLVCPQDYPSKPIRIVTTVAGSGSDFTARLIAQGISGPLGQPVVVDNRPNTVIGEFVAKSPADGYTLLVNGSSFWVGSLLSPTPYDTQRDFVAITQSERSPNVLVVHPSLPVKSVKDLIALAKARPGELNYGSAVRGSATHIAAELFKSMTGTNITGVPYKGGVQSTTALVAGEVQISFGSSNTVVPFIKSGRLRPLAVTSAEHFSLFPELPTVAATVPGYEAVGMTVLFSPAKTPAAIVNKLNQEMVRVLRTPDAKQKYLAIGSEAVGNTPEEIAALIKADVVRMAKLIKEVGIKAD